MKKQYIKIQLVGGNTYTLSVGDFLILLDEITDAEIGSKWVITKIEMEEEEYINLPEFIGH